MLRGVNLAQPDELEVVVVHELRLLRLQLVLLLLLLRLVLVASELEGEPFGHRVPLLLQRPSLLQLEGLQLSQLPHVVVLQ